MLECIRRYLDLMVYLAQYLSLRSAGDREILEGGMKLWCGLYFGS